MAIQPLVNLTDSNAGWGTITYNGYTFTGLRDVKLSGTPVYDSSARVVVSTRWRLLIHFFPVDASEGAHSLAMKDARYRLQEAGQGLLVTGMGFSDIAVNVPAQAFNRNDVAFGPKPGELVINQIGMIGAECYWDCTFEVKEGLGTQGNLAAFNYSVDYSIDEAGLTTRTLAGYLQITLARTPGQITVASSADAYRTQIVVDPPTGFRRGERRFLLSQDKARLDFSFTDRQLEAEAPPANCLFCDLDYEIASQPPGFARFTASLSGSITVPSGVPPIRAAEGFMQVFTDKQSKLAASVTGHGTAIPTQIRFSRPTGSRTSSFSANWLVTGCLNDLLANGGIWEPVAGVNWSAWAESMKNSGAWGNRGTAGLAYNVANDALIDLNVVGPIVPYQETATDAAVFTSGTSVFSWASIPAEASFLFYENRLAPVRDHNSATHRLAESYGPGELSAHDPRTTTGVNMAQPVSTGTSSTTTQYRGRPKDYILMTGKCMRIQHVPAVPSLTAVAGLAVQEVSVRIDGPKVVACIFGAKVYTLRWAILYRLTEGYLSSIPALANTALCCADSDEKANQTS